MVNDDRLLASIIEFSNQSRPEDVLVISNDFSVQRKSARLGIEVVDPDGSVEQ